MSPDPRPEPSVDALVDTLHRGLLDLTGPAPGALEPAELRDLADGLTRGLGLFQCHLGRQLLACQMRPFGEQLCRSLCATLDAYRVGELHVVGLAVGGAIDLLHLRQFQDGAGIGFGQILLNVGRLRLGRAPGQGHGGCQRGNPHAKGFTRSATTSSTKNEISGRHFEYPR